MTLLIKEDKQIDENKEIKGTAQRRDTHQNSLRHITLANLLLWKNTVAVNYAV